MIKITRIFQEGEDELSSEDFLARLSELSSLEAGTREKVLAHPVPDTIGSKVVPQDKILFPAEMKKEHGMILIPALLYQAGNFLGFSDRRGEKFEPDVFIIMETTEVIKAYQCKWVATE
jgi:hypothetical protein